MLQHNKNAFNIWPTFNKRKGFIKKSIFWTKSKLSSSVWHAGTFIQNSDKKSEFGCKYMGHAVFDWHRSWQRGQLDLVDWGFQHSHFNLRQPWPLTDRTIGNDLKKILTCRWLEGGHHRMDCPLEHHEPASLYTQYTYRVYFY